MIYRCSKCGCLYNSNSKRSHGYCKECKAAYDMEYRKKNKDKIAEYRKEHYQKNKDTIREKAADYYQKNKGKILDRVAEYRKTDIGKEVHKRAQKRYDQSEKGKDVMKRARHKRRAKLKGAKHEDWTPSEIFKRDQGICYICGLPVYNYDEAPNALKPQYDHVWPLDKGGADTPRNVKLSHAHCNAVKHNHWLSEVDREACREHIANVLEELAEELL